MLYPQTTPLCMGPWVQIHPERTNAIRGPWMVRISFGSLGRRTRKGRILPPSLVTTTTLKMGFHRRRRRQSDGGHANPETTPGDGWTNREPCQEACVGILPAPKGRKHFRAFVVHKIRLRLSLTTGWGANKALILESISFRCVLLFGPERRDIGMPLTCRRSHPKCLSRRV